MRDKIEENPLKDSEVLRLVGLDYIALTEVELDINQFIKLFDFELDGVKYCYYHKEPESRNSEE